MGLLMAALYYYVVMSWGTPQMLSIDVMYVYHYPCLATTKLRIHPVLLRYAYEWSQFQKYS